MCDAPDRLSILLPINFNNSSSAKIGTAKDATILHSRTLSFVNPKKVPQMANAETVCAGLTDIHEAKLTGLVLNERGYQRLRDTCLHEAGIVIASTDTFGIRNQGMDLMLSLIHI